MVRQPFFWRIFLLFTALQLVTLSTFLVLFSYRQEQMVMEAEQRRLHDSVVILRRLMQPMFEQDDRDGMDRLSASIAEETGARVTLIGVDGVVHADSERDPQTMENHKDRPELLEAAESGSGNSQRFSDTVKKDMVYFALRVDRRHAESESDSDVPEVLGYVRCALPLSELLAKAADFERSVWLVAVCFIVVSCAVTYVFIWHALQPVRNLTAATLAMAKGKYDQTVTVRRRDELGELATSFNEMSRGIAARERKLREAAERMAAVLSGMVEAVIAVDDQQRVMFANAAAADIFSIRTESVQGARLPDVIPNQSLNQIAVAILDGKDDLEMQNVEIEARSESVLSVNGSRLPGDPCPGVVLVMHDITELRRLERLRQEFVANVSHELKTPLSAILAYAETLHRGALDDPENREHFVYQIEEQAGRLSDLIQDMLQLARIEAGQALHEIVQVNLWPVVENCIASHWGRATIRKIQLVANATDPRVAVSGTREALRQILDNLVDNAIKYTQDGGRVEIDCEREGAFVVIQVKDDGIGIPHEHQERIFERFYRVDRARSREMGGTGLGLSIVKHIAQTLGGSVDVESDGRSGTRFHVRLPAFSPVAETQPQ